MEKMYDVGMIPIELFRLRVGSKGDASAFRGTTCQRHGAPGIAMISLPLRQRDCPRDAKGKDEP